MSTSSSKKPAFTDSYIGKIGVDLFAGVMSGINVTLVGHPFDTLKVRLQTQPSVNPIYNGLIDCFQKTMKWEGIGGLYKGVTSPLAGQMFFRASLFLANGEAKRYLSNYGTKKLTQTDFVVAGMFAWTIGVLTECPIDLFKSQMQVQIIKSKVNPSYVPEYSSVWDCTKKTLKMNGITGAYQGVVPHLMRNCPGGALHLGTYEYVRAWFAERNNIPTTQLTIKHNLIAGGAGGLLFWTVIYPVDVIKSAIQTDAPNRSLRKYKGTIDCAQKLYEDGGWKRFYRGFSPCLLRAVPANAVLLWTVTFITENLRV